MAKFLPSSVERAAQSLHRVRTTRQITGRWPATKADWRAAFSSPGEIGLVQEQKPVRPSVRGKKRSAKAEFASFRAQRNAEPNE